PWARVPPGAGGVLVMPDTSGPFSSVTMSLAVVLAFTLNTSVSVNGFQVAVAGPTAVLVGGGVPAPGAAPASSNDSVVPLLIVCTSELAPYVPAVVDR